MHCPKGITGGTNGKEPACQCRMQDTKDTQVQSLYWEDPLEEQMAAHSSTLAGEFHGRGRPAGYSLCGCTELDTAEATEHPWKNQIQGLTIAG